MAGITNIEPAGDDRVEPNNVVLPPLNQHGVDVGAAGGLVVLGRTTGAHFSVEDEQLLQLVVVPQLREQGVGVQMVEVCEDDRSCLRFTVSTAEAKHKLLAMVDLAYTDQIKITFIDPSHGDGTYSVLVVVHGVKSLYDLQHPSNYYGSYSSRCPQTLAANIQKQIGLRFLPVFERDGVGMAEGLGLRMKCWCPQDANVLLGTSPGNIISGLSMSFYDLTLHVRVKNEGAGYMLLKVEPKLGKAVIKRITGVEVSVDEALWANGYALLTVSSFKDYDELVQGKPRVFAGNTLAFEPHLYPVASPKPLVDWHGRRCW